MNWKVNNAWKYIIRKYFSDGVRTTLIFYLCPTCFYASDTADDCHEHALLRVDPGLPGDDRRKPVTDRNGSILSPAPYWFYEALLKSRIVSSSNSEM